MKLLYLVRHAKSDWSDSSLRDRDRPLNSRGKRDAPYMGRLLADRGLLPDALVSSPAVRALTTAQHFARALNYGADEIVLEDRIYEAMPDALQEVVTSLRDEWQIVLLFGHNPGFTDFANRFAARRIDNIPTCGVVRLESEVERWRDFGPRTARLTDFIYPKMFKG